jgi:hypothetical protein
VPSKVLKKKHFILGIQSPLAHRFVIPSAGRLLRGHSEEIVDNDLEDTATLWVTGSGVETRST